MVLGMMAALPVLLVATFSVVFPEWLLTRTGAEIVLFGGDLQRVALVLFYIAAWAFCLWFAQAVVVETVTQMRRLRRPHLAPVPAGVVGRLVAVLLAAAPVPTAFAQPPATAVEAPATDGPANTPRGKPVPNESTRTSSPAREPGPVESSASPDGARTVSAATAGSQTPKLESYVVRENDTLWGLALSRLGDGKRYREIYELNRDVIGPKPDLLQAGATILLPISAVDEPAQTIDQDDRAGSVGASSYTVKPGDTISEIADDHYGAPNRYPDIVAASADTIQPDGDRLTDPDHIEPGWILTLPDTAEPVSDRSPSATDDVTTGSVDGDPETTSQAPAGESSTSEDAPGAVTGPPHGAVPGPARPAVPDAELSAPRTSGPRATASPKPSTAADSPEAADEERSSEAPGWLAPWLLPGIASGAGLLAAGLGGVVLRGRKRQAAFRRPGRMIPPIPEDLVPIAATARIVGGPRVPDLRSLDLLLRQLGGPYLRQFTSRRPALISVELTDDTAILHLAEPAMLPAPWEGEGVRWSAPLSAAPDECDELVPYPMLVTVGTDPAGHAWLLDLERLRTATVVGDPDEIARFARHLVVELAMNPWTINLTTDAIGPIAPGARGLTDYRLEEHDDASALARFPGELRDAYENDVNSEDIEWYHAVVAEAAHADELAELVGVLEGDPGRNGLAVLLVGAPVGGPVGTVLAIRDGRLTVPGTDVDVEAVHLRQEEVDAAVRLCRLMADTTDVAVPVNPDARGWNAFVDEAGTPRPELVEARPADPDVPAGPGSLLPDTDAECVEKTGNTREDLARLAPVVNQPNTADDGSDDVESAGHDGGHDLVDPTLEQDLADWADPNCTRPRVKVLGPVSMWAAGPMDKVADKMPTIQAVLGYVALHPDGVIASQIAAMAGVETTNVRSRLADLRDWLGNRPDGNPWLPLGRGGRPSAKRPPHRFRIEGCLVDSDLLLRLKARAYRRGAAGLEDLVAALRLVRGRPFTLPRPDARWMWATEGEHRDAMLTTAIIDVTQVVVARAVLDRDLILAREAYRIGSAVDPDGEILKVSLAMVELADNHPERARDLAADILAKRGDVQPQDDLDRASKVMRQITGSGITDK
ncbi:LysM peptidoglycan-binding domain-containing protein [Myceligenerans xiligouense]|uniref:LysM peptidoglycan-binding domain-containing protein n=1 Tax=Myceligenerans xiligouense TaxID=253184 RepID=UPI0014769513|nr:LysM peptidoglycan-binding domain-containing protein [Myceligenerans xiligouense]